MEYRCYSPMVYRVGLVVIAIFAVFGGYIYFFQHTTLLDAIWWPAFGFLLFADPLTARNIQQRDLWPVSVKLRSSKSLAYEKEAPLVMIQSKMLKKKLSRSNEYKTKQGDFDHYAGYVKLDKTVDAFDISVGECQMTLTNHRGLTENHYYRVPRSIIIEILDASGLVPDPRQPTKTHYRALFLVFLIFVAIPMFLIPVIVALFG